MFFAAHGLPLNEWWKVLRNDDMAAAILDQMLRARISICPLRIRIDRILTLTLSSVFFDSALHRFSHKENLPSLIFGKFCTHPLRPKPENSAEY